MSYIYKQQQLEVKKVLEKHLDFESQLELQSLIINDKLLDCVKYIDQPADFLYFEVMFTLASLFKTQEAFLDCMKDLEKIAEKFAEV